ncbi:MAG: hypothetical protein DRO40_12750 [Thermoprotei archaeon]|nr:MAG: hypothetical protein DRO40_12750 [Thermoprotei archaeon]
MAVLREKGLISTLNRIVSKYFRGIDRITVISLAETYVLRYFMGEMDENGLEQALKQFFASFMEKEEEINNAVKEVMKSIQFEKARRLLTRRRRGLLAP